MVLKLIKIDRKHSANLRAAEFYFKTKNYAKSLLKFSECLGLEIPNDEIYNKIV
jgi:hypothetical protein